MQKQIIRFMFNRLKSQNSCKTKLNLVCGFTLVELMVTVSIVSLVMGVILFNYSTFNDNLTVSSATQEIAVATRETQIYGLSVKESAVGSNLFNYGYGLYLSLDDPQNYYIFVDLNNNGKFDVPASCTSGTECVQKIPLRNGVRVTSICGSPFGGGLTCPPGGTTRSVHIIFVRPNTEAKIRFVTGAGVIYTSGGELFQTGRVTLTSVKGKTGTVTIENTGQIYVQ